jgi:hypothetical protein
LKDTEIISKPKKLLPARNWGRVDEETRKLWNDLEFRKNVYESAKRAKHNGVKHNSKIPSFSPLYFKKYPQKLDCLHGWIRRDLNAIIPDSPVELIRDYIIALMKVHDIQSDIAHELLKVYLGKFTQHFIHELTCFAKSSIITIDEYDRYVQY